MDVFFSFQISNPHKDIRKFFYKLWLGPSWQCMLDENVTCTRPIGIGVVVPQLLEFTIVLENLVISCSFIRSNQCWILISLISYTLLQSIRKTCLQMGLVFYLPFLFWCQSLNYYYLGYDSKIRFIYFVHLISPLPCWSCL